MAATAFVVDDLAERRHATARAIRSAGIAAETFESATSFLKVFDPARTGCVVCNTCAPEKCGLDLLQRLRATGAEIPVLFVTDNGDVRTAVSALKGGAIDVLERPFEESVLIEHVRSAIGHDAEIRNARSERLEIAMRYRLLSERERLVMALVIRGVPTREIAERIGVKPKTVESQRANIMRKMEAEGVTHLVRMSMLLADASTGFDRPDIEPLGSG